MWRISAPNKRLKRQRRVGDREEEESAMQWESVMTAKQTAVCAAIEEQLARAQAEVERLRVVVKREHRDHERYKALNHENFLLAEKMQAEAAAMRAVVQWYFDAPVIQEYFN